MMNKSELRQKIEECAVKINECSAICYYLTNEIQEIKSSDKDIQSRETALGWRMYEDLQNITNELYNVLEKIN